MTKLGTSLRSLKRLVFIFNLTDSGVSATLWCDIQLTHSLVVRIVKRFGFDVEYPLIPTIFFISLMTFWISFDILNSMKQVRIYSKSKEASQSGRSNMGQWIVEAERISQQGPEPLMGWTQSGDTMNQIKMEFPSCEKAEAFAKSQGWRYTVTKPNVRKVKPRHYGDNFVCDMKEDN